METEEYLVNRVVRLEKENDDLKKALRNVQDKRLLDAIASEGRIKDIKKLLHPYTYGIGEFTGISINVCYLDDNNKLAEGKKLADLLNIETEEVKE